MSKRKLRLAIIGCGLIAQEHGQVLSQIAEAEIVACVDVDEERALLFSQQFHIPRVSTNSEDILNDESIEAVWICTHHNSHAPLAIRAAQVGKHIFLEKPLALCVEDCAQVAESVEKYGVKLMMGFKMRYEPLVWKARDLVSSPVLSVGQMLDARWPDDLWAQDPVLGGGNVISQGCHTIDLLRYFNPSPIREVFAYGGSLTHGNTDTIDTATIIISFDNGAVGTMIQSDAGFSPFTSKFFFELFDGHKSAALYSRLSKATFFDGEETRHTSKTELGLPIIDSVALENQAFINAVISGTPPSPSVIDGYLATLIISKAFESIRTGKPYQINEVF